jgi:hypothetical protein
VLDRGDHLGLGLEAADERRVVGQLGADDLDGDVPTEGPLRRPVHDRERAGADALVQDS